MDSIIIDKEAKIISKDSQSTVVEMKNPSDGTVMYVKLENR